jgi:hypothetical protein
MGATSKGMVCWSCGEGHHEEARAGETPRSDIKKCRGLGYRALNIPQRRQRNAGAANEMGTSAQLQVPNHA